MTSYLNRVRQLVDDEIHRQKLVVDARKADERDHLGFTTPWQRPFPWRRNGSAGRALTWLEEIASEFPDARPHDLVEQLEMRIDDEITTHPRTFTIKHLHGVLEYARQAADEQLVDGLMEALGITPQPWQHTYLEHIAISRPAFDPGGPFADAFREGLGVTADGVWGPITRKALQAHLGVTAPRSPWWRRAGRYIASWFADVWHNFLQTFPDTMAATAIIASVIIWYGALLYIATGGN